MNKELLKAYAMALLIGAAYGYVSNQDYDDERAVYAITVDRD